jgi:hypothetical protein
MPPWEALATVAVLCPLALWRLGALGVNLILSRGGCIAFVVAAFLTARVMVKRHCSSEERCSGFSTYPAFGSMKNDSEFIERNEEIHGSSVFDVSI